MLTTDGDLSLERRIPLSKQAIDSVRIADDGRGHSVTMMAGQLKQGRELVSSGVIAG